MGIGLANADQIRFWLEGGNENAENFVDLFDVVVTDINEGSLSFELEKFPIGASSNGSIDWIGWVFLLLIKQPSRDHGGDALP